ncbi:hypothetical protein GNF86_26765, partial [Clostridium perfringens]
DPAFEKFIGMPYVEVPCPFGCHSSYAAHYEQEFEASLAAFGIQPEFIYQSREYQSGDIIRSFCMRSSTGPRFIIYCIPSKRAEPMSMSEIVTIL